MGLAVTKRERALLLNSHVVQGVGWFRRLLEQHERLTRELVACPGRLKDGAPLWISIRR